MKRIVILLILFTGVIPLCAQEHQLRFDQLNILHYKFNISLNDSTDIIEGQAQIEVKFKKDVTRLNLDLVNFNDSTQKGMKVTSVTSYGNPLEFVHKLNQLTILFPGNQKKGTTRKFVVEYTGIPGDGLIISRNKFGDRTFFGDNWPDRARHWLPTVDHPSDKASIEFIVRSPYHYQVVSNGILCEESVLDKGIKLTHWREDTPISTKLMVIGVARFAVKYYYELEHIPVSSWVFPQNRKIGFSDYQHGTKALKYYSELIGPFPYKKLAHVQSKTRYGGMENAGCIFYSEKTVNGKNEQERLFAHETVHQWFGNSVTEQNWHHIWLSEGFATYLTHVYNQNFYGEDHFKKELKEDRDRVIRYARRNLTPVIDTTVTQYISLLNTNSYQKAAWFLHMLRNETGDIDFFKGLRKYYNDFKNGTALTNDFMKVMESVSGKQLDYFFRQWLYFPGFPVLTINWRQKSDYSLEIEVVQLQREFLFQFPLEIELELKNGKVVQKTLQISKKKTFEEFSVEDKVQKVIPDPSVKLLFEEVN